MAWSTVLVAKTKDGMIGFCGNVYVDDPTVSVTVGGSSRNPSLAEFNGAMVLGAGAINMFDTAQGQTTRINLTNTYYIQCRRGSGYTQGSYRYFESNLPDFNGVLMTSNVLNRMFYSISFNDDLGVAIVGLFTWAFPTNYSSTYNPLGNPSANLYNILRGLVPATDEPYGDDTYQISSGGRGDHDDTSDVISQDAIPIAAATRSGMCTAWVPNWGEIQDVANALLDPNIFQILGSNVVKFSDVIIGLSIFPCAIPATDLDTVKANVLGIEIGTGVQAHIANDQFVSIDCGTLDVKEYWGNCLDYNPYTRISIFLPFCGTYELDVDEVMGKTIGVSYRIDIMSGACLATIKINGSVFYQYSGQCSAQVPLSSVSFDQFLSSMIELGVATATGVGAIGAAGGAVSAAKDQMFVPQSRTDLRSHTEEIASAEQNYSKVKEQSANSIADAAVGAVMGSKGFYQHAGAMSGSPGFLGVKKPYLIIKRPEQLIPGMYGKFHGFPCNTTAVLGDLAGYTEVGDIRLNIPEATVDEIIECEQLLKGGVVI